MDDNRITTTDPAAGYSHKECSKNLINLLLQHESQLRLITDPLPVLIAYLDTELRYRFVNRAYADWFGHDQGDLIGKPLSSLLSRAQYEYRLPYLNRALGGETVSFEGTIHAINGERQVRITYVPDIDGNGRIHGINSLVWDITSGRQSVESLRKLQHDYSALINSIEGIVWEADARTFQFTFVSTRAEHILGYPVSTWLSERDFWINHVHPDDRDWVYRECREATIAMRNNDFEYRMVAADGRTVWLRDIVTVRIENGIQKLRGVMIDITRQKENEEQLDYLSNNDPLTGLPNRNLFLDRLEQALAYTSWEKRPLAVVSIGVNRFRRINESLGHEAGDEVLRQLAGYLRRSLRGRDTVARLAGNEFALILTEMSREADVGRIMEKLFEGLGRPFQVAGHDILVELSAGISMPPDDGRQADTLLKHAEFAMHSLKRRTAMESAYQHYSEDLGNQISGTLALEHAIRRAIEEDEFELYYQPQYDLGSNDIIAVEALLRWSRPETGELITPDRFIPLAEESGLIVPLGDWVLRRACRDYQGWLRQGIAPERIAVNISARQFRSASLVETIRGVLNEHDMRPSQLELELTESVLQTESATDLMHALARLGIRFAIDDFGIGYSSLNYLKHLPVGKLKIDRSFLRGIPEDEDNRGIVDAIISMARSLRLTVLAEGVENATQRRYLRTRGCDQAQGYLYARPLPRKDIETLLRESRRK